ncbi:MAG TPA: noncanonical pyrimidine nucleotidase, YjjG family [Flavobacterium sp.]|nr:noncanonical pyrimidine nucleotidase, YjjG family [Flavobacterium sp.]
MFYNKKHLFFDLDHTLWDFDKNSGFAFETIFKKFTINVPLDDFLQVYLPTNQRYWKLYQANNISYDDLRFFRLKDVFVELDYSISTPLIHQLSEEYINYLPEYNYLFDGAIEVLDYLKTKYQLHIITNGFSLVQDRKIKNSNIKHYFQTITNSELAGQKKPHPSIFDYALKSANALKEESIMIGDSFEADILGAIEFGIDAIYFNENNVAIAQNIYQIKHLLELKSVF